MQRRRIRLTIDSDPADVPLVGAAIHALCSEVSLAEEDCARIELCVVEAVTNAIRHAYRNERGHEVTVTFTVSDDRVDIEIADRGQPMPEGKLERTSAAVLDDALADPEAIAEGGRGLAIMKAVMDEARYHSKQTGALRENALTLTRRLGRVAPR
jgi:serine/threonine-protein kinase RsbW